VGRFGRSTSGEVSAQQFIDTVDRVIGDAREHIAQIRFRINAIEFWHADQAVIAAARSPPRSDPVILPTQSKHSERSLDASEARKRVVLQ